MKSNGLAAARNTVLGAAFFAALTALTALVAGCAADASTNESAPAADDGAEIDELNAVSLRGSTAMKGTVAAGSTISLQYDRSDRLYPRSIPYLAVEIVDAPASTGDLH